MIELYHVSKVYARAELPALDDVNLRVDKGEFVFLTGPSGAGKTTLLRLLFLAEMCSRGQVLINGKNVAHLRASQLPLLRRTIGVVFQDFKLIDNRSAEQNVALALEVQGLSQAVVAPRVFEALRRVGLAHKRASLPQRLSGGEQQRVAIARAIVADPVILLADEPTGNLDPERAVDIMNLLSDTNARGTTVVVATHDPALLERYRHRVITLENGRVASAGIDVVTTAINQLRSVVRGALLGFTQGAGVHGLSVGIIALSLTAMGAFGLMVQKVSGLAEAWGRDLTVTAFLKSDADDSAVESLRQRAGRMRGASGAHLVTREQARQRLVLALGQRADLLSGLEERVIPAAIEVELLEDATREDSAAIAEVLKGEDVVEEVAYGEEELTRLGAVVGILRLAAGLLGSLIALVTVLVISNTLKLTVLGRREEIGIMKLVGASDFFVRAPFLLEGAIQGFLGAGLASGCLLGLHSIAALRVEQILSEAFGAVSLGEAPIALAGWMLVMGTVLGIVGGLVGVSRFLKA